MPRTAPSATRELTQASSRYSVTILIFWLVRLFANKAIDRKFALSAGDRMSLKFTATEDGKRKRAHQIFLTIASSDSSLAESWPLEVKSDGKAKIELVRSLGQLHLNQTGC